MQNKIYLSFIAVILSLTVGCSTTGNYKTTDATYNHSNLSGIAIVAQESQKALQAQQLLVKYREQANASLVIRQADFDNEKIMLEYIGKPSPLLNSIAIKYGYRYLEVGQKRELPTINFHHYYTTPKDALALIDGQLQDTARIYLNKEQKIISLTYQ